MKLSSLKTFCKIIFHCVSEDILQNVLSSQFYSIFAHFHQSSREINSCRAKMHLKWVIILCRKVRLVSLFSNQYFYHFFQISTRTISDIDKRVKRIDGIARKYYSQSELEPLDTLVQKTEEIIRLMSDLSTSMRCEPIHM